MKLRIPDWKSAWFENQISERFFQEVSRLEKGTVKSLDSSAQWMEQVMIEVGQLAQAMIRLESHDAPDPQIRQAFDKALRLSAISLHLMTTLDALARNEFSSGISSGTYKPHSEAMPPNPDSVPLPPPIKPMLPKVQDKLASPSAATPPGNMPFPPAWTALPAHSGQGGPSPASGTPGAPSGADSEDPLPSPDDSEMEERSKNAPLISSIVQVSGLSQKNPSRMRDTIQSLSLQGLSRAEIEMVTGEPRHIVEAVLEHHRPRRERA